MLSQHKAGNVAEKTTVLRDRKGKLKACRPVVCLFHTLQLISIFWAGELISVETRQNQAQNIRCINEPKSKL